MADNLQAFNSQLMPCPFCGNDAHLAWYKFTTEQVVAECENPFCLTAVCGARTPEEAIARWNNRAKETYLKACPFCGSGAELEHFDNGECEMYQVKCKNPLCQAETPSYDKAEDVKKIWNTRDRERGDIN